MTLELAYDILETLQTLQEAAEYMKTTYEEEKLPECLAIRADIIEGLQSVCEVCKKIVPQGSPIKLHDACVCALESIYRIDEELMETNRHKALQKITFELIPIIETTILQFYYWGIVNEYPEKKEEFKAYLEAVGLNRHIEEAERTGQYKYDLTIYVVGYNHLDYTKRCVESILKQLPTDIRYELLLFNHGSSDGTKEYFDSIPGAKTFDVAINSAIPGLVIKAIEGKYVIAVSNDIIMGENAITNLYRCISEHPEYGWIVPTTPNIANLQTISSKYTNEVEFVEFTKNNNVYNELKHEERVRLCNPVTVYKTANQLKLEQELFIEKSCCSGISFPDDKCSLWMRRNGFKLILAKDAYCHHYGSVTIGKPDPQNEERKKFYLEGRIHFLENFGIDPWVNSSCYDKNLIENISYDFDGQINILGVNCGLGSNPLKIREVYKENGKDVKDIRIYNFFQEERYCKDLPAVSDEVCWFEKREDINQKIPHMHFQYVIVENEVKGNVDMESYVNELYGCITFDILCYYKGEQKSEVLPEIYEKYEVEDIGCWIIMKQKVIV